MQDTAVLALVALATALTALSLSPSNSSCTQACAIALAAVLPGLQGLRALSLPSVTASHSAAPLLRALAGITGLTSLDVSHGLVCDADLDVLVKCSPWCVLRCCCQRGPCLCHGFAALTHAAVGSTPWSPALHIMAAVLSCTAADVLFAACIP